MIRLAVAAAAFCALAGGAFAQDFPAKPIRILVGFAPGGGTDITARIIAKGLTEIVGQQVVVENRPGAGGVLATDLAAQAAPDGYTILLGNVGAFCVSPHMQAVRYDVERDFAPITMAVTFPNVLVVHPSVPARTLAEYLALAKKPEAKLSYGSSGVASAGHLAGELLKVMAGVDIPHISYRGGGPAMADLLGGHLPSIFASMPSALEYIKQGRIVAIAVTGPQRTRDLAGVPTVAESDFPGYEATNWYAFVAPKATPAAIVVKLNADIGRALRDPGVVAELDKHGLEPAPGTPQDLARTMKQESETWAKVVKTAGIKPE
jgi:tripartite-type tricarboxylate transporter receptor subunit TctC